MQEDHIWSDLRMKKSQMNGFTTFSKQKRRLLLLPSALALCSTLLLFLLPLAFATPPFFSCNNNNKKEAMATKFRGQRLLRLQRTLRRAYNMDTVAASIISMIWANFVCAGTSFFHRLWH